MDKLSTFRNRPCQNCKANTNQELCLRIMANSAQAAGWRCLVCDWWTKSNAGMWIELDLLIEHGINTDELRVAQVSDQKRCAVCGERGAEEHHWAPRHLFDKDCDKWPKDYLCLRHHNEWHQRVTPNMKTKGPA